MDEIDIEDLTIEQYLRLTQESQTPKKIEDMTIAENLEYEKKVNENHISNTKSYMPTYFSKSTPTHNPILEFSHYYDLNQPGTEFDGDSEDMEEDVEYMTDDEEVMSEQEESNHGYTQNIQHFKEKDDVDEWLNAEITKHMGMQGVKNMKDALISIIKSIRQEMKDDIIKRKFKALTACVNDEVSSIASNEVDRADDNTLNTAPCYHNLYATTTLDAKDNIMPKRVYEYLGLDKLRDASTLENTTETNEHLGTVNILVKFTRLEFSCNFIIETAEDVIILGRPFLESTRAQIDVFNKEISFEAGNEKLKFNVNSHRCIEKIYMVDIGQEEETFNPIEIGIDLFSYESLACLEFEQRTRIGHNNLHESNHEFIFNKWILDSYDVEEEYAREIGDPYSRRFDEYNRVFNNEIEHLSNEYILRIGKKEDEMWRIGDEKTDCDPPYVNVKTFEVKKYSFKGGRSFICITDREDEALPLGRMNRARFKAMIRKELDANKIQKLGGDKELARR
ncbi:phospholipase-like protein [Tanacetum coccineum]